MSPEQTGRMNRVDRLAQRPLFAGRGLLSNADGDPALSRPAIRSSGCIATLPARHEPPRERAAGVPEPIFDIVTKLWPRWPTIATRAPRASGRPAKCFSQWQAARSHRAVHAGHAGRLGAVRGAAGLYGREKEVAALVRAFERVSATGAPATVLISGYSGIGKTTLVQELYRPTVRARGYFIAGKFDQYKRGIPYTIISQAFGSLVRQLLGESEERIGLWRSRFQEALGINAQLIVDVVPRAGVDHRRPAARAGDRPVRGGEPLSPGVPTFPGCDRAARASAGALCR